MAKPAPGELEKVRAFVNTLEIDQGTDELITPEGLAAALDRLDLVKVAGPRTSKPSKADLRRAVQVREALRAVLLANNGEPLDQTALHTLNRAAREARFSLVFCGTCDVEYEPHATGVAGGIGKLLSIVADSMADGTWDRLKACSSDECSWAFYDHARNRSGKWCDMAECGNKMKARAYRARRRP